MSRLRVVRFPAGAALAGEVVGALERPDEAGVLDALFVTRDPETGAAQAVDLVTGHADGTIAALLDFRLSPSTRPAVTRRTLSPHRGAVPPATILALADGLAPGAAVLALLVAGEVPAALDDAAAATGAEVVADEEVSARTLADVAPLLRDGP